MARDTKTMMEGTPQLEELKLERVKFKVVPLRC